MAASGAHVVQPADAQAKASRFCCIRIRQTSTLDKGQPDSSCSLKAKSYSLPKHASYPWNWPDHWCCNVNARLQRTSLGNFWPIWRWHSRERTLWGHQGNWKKDKVTVETYVLCEPIWVFCNWIYLYRIFAPVASLLQVWGLVRFALFFRCHSFAKDGLGDIEWFWCKLFV